MEKLPKGGLRSTNIARTDDDLPSDRLVSVQKIVERPNGKKLRRRYTVIVGAEAFQNLTADEVIQGLMKRINSQARKIVQLRNKNPRKMHGDP